MVTSLTNAISAYVPIIAELGVQPIPGSALFGADMKNREPPETASKFFLTARQRMAAVTLGRIRESCKNFLERERISRLKYSAKERKKKFSKSKPKLQALHMYGLPYLRKLSNDLGIGENVNDGAALVRLIQEHAGNGNTINERTQLELDMTEIAEVEAKRKVTLNLEV